MTARNNTQALQARASRYGLTLDFDTMAALRRAQMTLHRWGELECGGGNDYASWAIERDEATGLPYRVTYPHSGASRRVRVADKEAGALRRIADLAEMHGFHYYHQTDPRGCALYISKEPLTDLNYNHGLAVCD